jgi:hypothetical protein
LLDIAKVREFVAHLNFGQKFETETMPNLVKLVWR